LHCLVKSEIGQYDENFNGMKLLKLILVEQRLSKWNGKKDVKLEVSKHLLILCLQHLCCTINMHEDAK
jgi:hypothetical protein